MTLVLGGGKSTTVDLDLESDDEPQHRTAIAQSSLESLALGAPTLLRLVENLCPEEVDPKHRRLRLNNAVVRDRLLAPLPAALDLLCVLGYVLQEDEGDTCLCLDESRRRPGAAAMEARWLRELVDRTWSAAASVSEWACPACTLRNGADAVQCGACGGPRSPASIPTIPKPQLASSAAPSPATSSPTQRRGSPARHTPGTGSKNNNSSVNGARAERLQERQRILAEAQADRQRFEDVVGAKHSSQSQGPAAIAGASAQSSSSVCAAAPSWTALRIRLPDGGASVEVEFHVTEPILHVFERVDALLRQRAGEEEAFFVEDYSLLQAIPKRVFLREVLGDRTLAELALVPSATLSVLRAEDRGRVQSGGVETALLTGDIDGLSYDEILELESRIGDCTRSTRCRLTQSARERMTRVHPYPESGGRKRDAVGESLARGGASEEELKCSICLVEFELGVSVRTLWCGHCFHLQCVDRWFTERDDCPVCRKPGNATSADA